MNLESVKAAQTVLDSAQFEHYQEPLRSIFSVIESPYQEPSPDSPNWIYPHRFGLHRDAVFPKPRTAISPHAIQAHAAAYGIALQAARANPDVPLRLEQTLALLQDYGWSLPSSELAVSLYDHLRTKAAIAAAQTHPNQMMLLVGGDLSGIQSFLYTIRPQKAAKSLRARSVYLQFLTDAVANWILRRSQMPATNLMYSGGGRFYVLIPQTDAIMLWQRELNEALFTAHRGELYVALGWSEYDPQRPDAAFWRSLNERIKADGRRKFANFTPERLKRVFEPQGHGGNQDNACAVCDYLGEDVRLQSRPDEDEAPTAICRLCLSFIDNLAEDLRHADFVCIETIEMHTLGQRRPTWNEVFNALGMAVSFKKQQDLARFIASRKNLRIGALNGQPLDDLREAYPQHIFYQRPMVNITPTTTAMRPVAAGTAQTGAGKPRTKEFDELVQESIGTKRLGVLRMDVDDLGDLFAKLSAHFSLSRVSSLSSALSRFFEGYVGTLAANHTQRPSGTGQDLIYSVYSGGDDLFLVGAWDVMPGFAAAISQELNAYAGYTPHVHISGGLTLHTAKYPISEAAKEADEALEHAKSHGKNALNFLGQTMRWEAFAGQCSYPVLQTVEALRTHLDATPSLPNSFLQLLQQLYSAYRNSFKQTHLFRQFHYGPWVWRGEYMFHCIAERIKDHQSPLREFIRSVQQEYAHSFQEVIAKEFKPDQGLILIERLGLAARWAQLLNRKEAHHGDV